jgi:hypothetical protein
VLGPGELIGLGSGWAMGHSQISLQKHESIQTESLRGGLCDGRCKLPIPEATKTIDWTDPRFEALVEVTSRAAQDLRERADRLIDTFIGLSFEDSNPYTVGSILTKPDAIEPFTKAGHKGYSDLNRVELDCARAIDIVGFTWVRNPL